MYLVYGKIVYKGELIPVPRGLQSGLRESWPIQTPSLNRKHFPELFRALWCVSKHKTSINHAIFGRYNGIRVDFCGKTWIWTKKLNFTMLRGWDTPSQSRPESTFCQNNTRNEEISRSTYSEYKILLVSDQYEESYEQIFEDQIFSDGVFTGREWFCTLKPRLIVPVYKK